MTFAFNLVRQRFGRAVLSYDTVGQIQRKAGEFLLEKTRAALSEPPQTILDVGTGTGLMPMLLLPYYPHSQYCLNDIAPEMLAYCRKKFMAVPSINYQLGDLSTLNVAPHDLIVSNFALQWASNLQEVLRFYHNKTQRVFAFSVLMAGTFAQWYALLARYQPFAPPPYLDADALRLLCRSISGAGSFYDWQEEYTLCFANPRSFLLYLQKLGANAHVQSIALGALRSLLRNETKPFTTQYRVFYGLFQCS
ncbi:methyltransferase domain-containing protein [Bartonella sp. DGB2]|uniref:methyltransferase domain-containing protein n=1 Tax=Bartonella sp. DGB2 TaxID=3388426 RepID=UPI00398F9F60